MKNTNFFFYFKIAVDLHAASSVFKSSSFYSFKNIDHLRIDVFLESKAILNVLLRTTYG